MTDGSGWQSPSGPEARPTPPTYGSVPPQHPQGGYAAPAPGGWTPPPKPGLIPLRPLSFGTILGSSFRVMRRNPGPTFGLAVALYGFVTIVYIAALGGVIALFVTRMSSASVEDSGTIFAGSVGLIALSSLIPVALTVIAGGILQGIISLEVSRATLGEKLRTRGLFRLARGRIASLIGWSVILTVALLLYFIIASVALGLIIGFVGITASSGNSAGATTVAVVGAVLLSIVIGLGLVALASWVGTKLSLVPSVIMLERLTMFAAAKRSWQLTNGHFWRTFGTQLLISLIISTASQVVTTPLTFIGGIVISLSNPNGDPTGSLVAGIILYVVIGIVTVVVGAVGLVTQTSALTLIYIDIRMRKEGLDLELLHFVEAKQAGSTNVANPYLRSGHPNPTVSGTSVDSSSTGSPWS